MNEDLERHVLDRTAALAEANEMMTLEIEDRLRIESELRLARERYRLLVEDLPAVVYQWHVGDPGGEESLSYTSPQIERLLGYTPQEWDQPGLWATRLHPHDRERVLASTAIAEMTGEPLDQEYRYLAKDGRVVWVHSHATLLKRDRAGRPLLYQGVLIDISARKEAEGKAEDAEERLGATEMLGSVGLSEFDLVREPSRHVEVRYLSPAFAQMIDTTVAELTRDPDGWARRIHPDDLEQVLSGVEEQFEAGLPAERAYRIVQPDGGMAWIRAVSRCIGHDEQGRPSRFRSAIVDITREKEEHERLRTSDDALRSFVEGLPGIPWRKVVAHGPGSGRTVYVGPQIERILGYTEQELLAEPDHFSRMIHPDDRARIRERALHHDRTAEHWSEEFRVIARDGRVVWFRSEGSATRREGGVLEWHGVVFDITTSKPPETFDRPELQALAGEDVTSFNQS